MRLIRLIGLIWLIGLIGLISTVAYADTFTSASFKVIRPTIDELGGYSNSASFRLKGDIPFIQPLKGILATTTVATTVPSTPGGGGGGGGIAEPFKPKPKPDEKTRKRVDFNNDGKVDFVDFSILLYYFDKSGSIIIPFDLNSDGQVEMIDISIFMYYWDGN